MPVISDAQIAAAARSAGFSGDQVAVAVAVALAESSGNTEARNPSSNTKGLWQIHPVHADLLRRYNAYDATDNARMAYAISGQGKNWRPWVAHTSGAYRRYMSRAQKAAGTSATPPAATPGQGQTPTSGAATTVTTGDLSYWPRIGLAVLGGILILIAVLPLLFKAAPTKAIAKALK